MEDLISFAVGFKGLERVLIVIFAGATIYFGYRLFINLPLQNNQKGELEVPGLKVVMSRVGPGVFFAGFGAAILISSYLNPIEIKTPEIEIRGAISSETPEPIVSTVPSSIGAIAINEQEKARRIIAVQSINCLPKYAQHAKSNISLDDIELAIRDAKLALLRTVWSEEDWGSFKDFNIWTRSGKGSPNNKILKIYMDNSGC